MNKQIELAKLYNELEKLESLIKHKANIKNKNIEDEIKQSIKELKIQIEKEALK